eukprot:scaffold35036_cov96-Isochrysis_galbana.AAC.1
MWLVHPAPVAQPGLGLGQVPQLDVSVCRGGEGVEPAAIHAHAPHGQGVRVPLLPNLALSQIEDGEVAPRAARDERSLARRVGHAGAALGVGGAGRHPCLRRRQQRVPQTDRRRLAARAGRRQHHRTIHVTHVGPGAGVALEAGKRQDGRPARIGPAALHPPQAQPAPVVDAGQLLGAGAHAHTGGGGGGAGCGREGVARAQVVVQPQPL